MREEFINAIKSNHKSFDVKLSDETVGNILRRHGIAPAPKRSQTTTWKDFIQSHMDVSAGQGLIVARTVALRPYPALKLFRDAMYASLKDKLPPDVWDYPTP